LQKKGPALESVAGPATGLIAGAWRTAREHRVRYSRRQDELLLLELHVNMNRDLGRKVSGRDQIDGVALSAQHQTGGGCGPSAVRILICRRSEGQSHRTCVWRIADFGRMH
jgi:hypothetical protein